MSVSVILSTIAHNYRRTIHERQTCQAYNCAGFDEFRWPRPVRPGDGLHIESEVLEVRASKSLSNQGLIKVRTTTLNQNNEAVQVQIANLIVPRRQSGEVG